jgi:hypothetical protein
VAEGARNTAAYRVHRMLVRWVGQLTHHEEAAVRELLDEHAKLVQLRARLADLGETREEWAADGPAGWMQWPGDVDSERFARSIVEQAAQSGVAVKLMRRLAGEWREVPDA